MLDVIGLVMVLSASSVTALREYGSAWYFFERQLLWVGSVRSLLRRDARRLPRAGAGWCAPLLGVARRPAACWCSCRASASGRRVARWLGAGIVRIQPSELAKLALLLFAADLLARRGATRSTRRASRCGRSCWSCQRDRARSVHGAARPRQHARARVHRVRGVVRRGRCRCASWRAVLAAGAVASRSRAWRSPTARGACRASCTRRATPATPATSCSSRSSGSASGGVTGVGLGASRAKWGFLPNAHTDFIFAIIGEELGLIGACSSSGCSWRSPCSACSAALRAPDRFGTLLAGGITAWMLARRSSTSGRRSGSARHRRHAAVRVLRWLVAA